MSKRVFLSLILAAALSLFSNIVTKAQCTVLSYKSLIRLWNDNAKEDKLLEQGFDKRSGNTYARCKIEMCKTADSVSRNFNEFVFIYDDEVMYSFTDKDAYLQLKTELKRKANYAGYAMFDEIKREYYYDGKTCYCFYVGLRSCLSSKIPDYNIGFLQKVPAYVEKE